MTKFSDFIKGDYKIDSKKTEKVEKDIDELINKYSTYSESDLMSEFLTK